MIATLASLATGLACASVLAQDPSDSFVIVPDVTLWSLSADGNAACGYTNTHAVRWTRSGGVELLPKLPGREAGNARAYAISWDGRTICGTSSGVSPRVAWIWREGQGLLQLPDVPDAYPNSYPQAISGDGRTCAGICASPSVPGPAFWNDSGVHPILGTIGTTGLAVALSYAGDVGAAFTVLGLTPYGYWFDAAGNVEPIDSELGGFSPMAVSADGSLFVGGTWVNNHSRAAFWSRPLGVDHLPGVFAQLDNSLARGISADQRTICGDSQLGSFWSAWIWDARNQARALRVVATDHLQHDPGHLDYVKAVSADGRTFVGMPTPNSSSSYVLRLRAPCAGDVDDGSMSGGRDGAVTVDDLLAFVTWYQLGDPRADLDDGAARGVPDASITIDDLLFFLSGYESGC